MRNMPSPTNSPRRRRVSSETARDLMSEAGSLASEARELFNESMESATETASALLRMPLRCAGVGVMFMLLPIFVMFIMPLMLMLSPLIVPIGFGLTVFGLGRAGLIVTLRGPTRASLRVLEPATPDASQAVELNLARARRELALPASVDRRGGTADQEADELLRVERAKDGTLRELNTLAGKRATEAVKHVTALVRNNVMRATRDISGEVEVHLQALQVELQSWAGANPNLKPYCHGHIGWLLRQEAREAALVQRWQDGRDANNRSIRADIDAADPDGIFDVDAEIDAEIRSDRTGEEFVRAHQSSSELIRAHQIRSDRTGLGDETCIGTATGAGGRSSTLLSPKPLPALGSGGSSTETRTRSRSVLAGTSTGSSSSSLSSMGSTSGGARARGLGLWSPRQRPELDLTNCFHALLGGLPPAPEMLTPAVLRAVPLPRGVEWDSLVFLLVPGLLTKWYPLYMKHLLADFKRLGLCVQFSRVDTDQPVRVNAARLRHEVLELAQDAPRGIDGRDAPRGTRRRVMLLGHSKGAVDAAAALSLFPELIDFVAGVVSLQGPHGGSAIAHDLSNTQVQKSVVLGALEKLLRGCRHAVLDLSFEARQDFLRHHPYPLHRVPTLCVATCDRAPSSLLRPLIEYVAVRYGEDCDGLVCQGDAILPHCPRVVLEDMDHFGPAWPSFPATDRYDPTRLWLVCISMALRYKPLPPPAAEATVERTRSAPCRALAGDAVAD